MMTSLVFLAVFLVCGTVAVEKDASPNNVIIRPNVENRIVGGQPIGISQWNSIVSLQHGTFLFIHLCGGSILTNFHILTAASCFPEDIVETNPALWRVRAGSSNYGAGGSYHQAIRIIKHPEFNPDSFDANIAVLRLLSPMTISPTIGQATIPPQGASVPDETLAMVAGWGGSVNDGSSSQLLQYTVVLIVSRQECFNAYLPWGGISPRMLCAGWPNGGRDACRGDGGGPLTVFGVVYGIVSWGNDCALPGYPGVYTSVSSFTDWIVETVMSN